ncbi:MAG: efflux RND transporter periplasmic adaptor subunit [Oxalicibacterium faecigallinarum]|uniref:efflux RND transporter periplasmic adaptor subunit n=1 Tax=Oxalicibacterium faecigallinarum TaxID=573741 RepID=UPI0028085103|nr:efflux RND transporter periplasmic adaptor subunit [Oxalicibacterium faecigallinarum]MDQ7970166.1 efflux RND transporter periplasmic adaptor subunit [Oxalicibacterium faecigallinarum]
MSSTQDVSPSASRRTPFSRRLIWIALALLFIGLALFLLLRSKENPAQGPNPWRGPVAVRVEPARQENFEVKIQAIGTVTPYVGVTVRSRVDGELARVLVREGQQVEKGQLLAEIDPRQYRVQLAQAEGQKQQNLAQLKNAESELARYQQLFKQDSIARQQLERQEALVQQLRGTQQSDQAQVDNARLQLSYTRIEAPIAGRVGLRRVDMGNLVTANDANGLFTLLQMQPIAVQFNVPETQVEQVRAAHAAKKPPVAEAWDRNMRDRLAQGRLDTLDNQIDVATGTLRLKARFENADDRLFPNQFVNLRLALETLNDVITIPSDAIQHASRGSYVYVVKDGKARVRTVELGPSSDGRIVVLKGIAKDEAVVLEGLDRLEEGKEVILVEAGSAASATPAATTAR